jgi:hypothetical protein
MKDYLKAWALANLIGALLVSPVVLHVVNSKENTPLGEPVEQVDHWEDYKQSKWY